MAVGYGVYDAPRTGPAQSVQFVKTNGMTITDVVQLFDDIVLTEQEQNVTAALRIIENSIERIASVGIERRPYMREGPGGVVLKLHGVPYRVPIGSVGDGMWRMWGWPWPLRTPKKVSCWWMRSIRAFTTLSWRTCGACSAKGAVALDVQVFATTHSRDCYESLASVVQPGSESTVSRFSESIRPVNAQCDFPTTTSSLLLNGALRSDSCLQESVPGRCLLKDLPRCVLSRSLWRPMALHGGLNANRSYISSRTMEWSSC